MELCLNLAVFADRSISAALDQAISAGISTVELNFESQDRLTPLALFSEPKQLEALRAAIRTRGMRIGAIGNHTDSQGICDHEPRSAEQSQSVERLLSVARIAAELEVDLVIGFTGSRNQAAWFPWPNVEVWDDLLPSFVETWMPILDEFQRLGVRFAHEPHPLQFAYDIETCKRVDHALEHRKQWGYNLDTGNMAMVGCDPAVFIDELGDKVLHVHAKDFERVTHNVGRSGIRAHGDWARLDRGYRFRIPGWGQLDWRAIFSQLQLQRFTGLVSIEHEDPCVDREEGVDKSVEFLQTVLFRRPPAAPWW